MTGRYRGSQLAAAGDVPATTARLCGHLTGAYWLETENSDSLIPEHFADAMQQQIKSRIGRPPAPRTEPRQLLMSPDGRCYWDGQRYIPMPAGFYWGGYQWVPTVR